MTNSESSSGDRWSRFENEAASKYPATWVPEAPGDSLVGEYVRHTDGKSRDGESSCEILVLKGKDGTEHAVWLWQRALQDLGRHAGLKPGTLVYLEYQGRKRSLESGHEYAAFRTVIEGQEAKRETLPPSVHAPLERRVWMFPDEEPTTKQGTRS